MGLFIYFSNIAKMLNVKSALWVNTQFEMSYIFRIKLDTLGKKHKMLHAPLLNIQTMNNIKGQCPKGRRF